MENETERSFGTAYKKANGNEIRVTYNESRGVAYVHIREYNMDGDSGNWYPTSKGYALLADETTSVAKLLDEAAEHAARRHRKGGSHERESVE